MKKPLLLTALGLILFFLVSFDNSRDFDTKLLAILEKQNYTGDIQKQLEVRLGRKLDRRKIELGRLIFFDNGLGLHQDNSCAGCHAPGFGFGDSQSIAIGVDNNGTVGIHRTGPRNQRRAPSVINTAFYPRLMWNSRFSSLTNDPFDISLGISFPPPEGDSLFSILYDYVKNVNHLLVAQAHVPFTELPEMAGFTSTSGHPIAFSGFSGLTLKDNGGGVDKLNAQPLLFLPLNEINNKRTSVCQDPDFAQFDDGNGFPVPPIDPQYNSQNFGIRAAVLDIINTNPEYVNRFKAIYPEVAYKPVNFIMVGEVIAEFEFFLTFARAPLDKFATGDKYAMTNAQKRGALIFFGKGKCVSCHAVSGSSNQMFSDFNLHNAGTPQIYPLFGFGTGDVPFSELNCPNKTSTGTLDYGREEFSGDDADRYKFRTSPLRNVKLQSSFFHNGSFKDLKKAIKYHLDPAKNIKTYVPSVNGVPRDLHFNPSNMTDVMASIDAILENGIKLSENDVNDLVEFVRDGLYDSKASPERLKLLIPETVPSGVKVAFFEDRHSYNLKSFNVDGDKEVEMDAAVSTANLFNARVESNPTYDMFSIVVSSKSDLTIKLIITDQNGNIVETRNDIRPGEFIRFGQEYHSGFFLAHLIQGNNTINLKLIKM